MARPYITKTIRVSGTTFQNRQNYLAGLSRSKQPVPIFLYREPSNPHDKNAIKVMVRSSQGACFPIGYIPKEEAAILAPFMDRKGFVHIDSAKIIGGNGLHYGVELNIRY